MKIELRNIISDSECLDVPVASVGDNDNLYAAGLSSLGTIRVMLAIEEALGIEIPDELITFDLFQSIDSLASKLASVVQDARRKYAPFATMPLNE